MRLCYECRHFQSYKTFCKRPLSNEVEPIYGRPAKTVDDYCDNERRSNRSFWRGREKCGPKGRFWEQSLVGPGPGSRPSQSWN